MNIRDLYKANGAESELGMIWEPEEEEEFGRSRARFMRFPQSRRNVSRIRQPVRQPRRPIQRRRRRPRPINLGMPSFPEPQSQGNEYVRWIQTMLNQLLNLRLPVHGMLDVQTRSAIRSFQEKNGLPVTGIVGPDTERALMGTKDGQAPAAGGTKAEEPASAEPSQSAVPSSEPGPAMPTEPAAANSAAEFEWEAFNNLMEFTDQETSSTVTRAVPKTIWRYNTDLDAPYFGGNFNFLYNGGANEALITFNTHLSYRKNYSDTEKRNFINNLQRAVDVWDRAAEVQVKDIYGNFSKKVTLRFKLNLVRDPQNANKKTDVHPPKTRSAWFMIDRDRETVMRDLNVYINSTQNVLVHELGHVWGLLDEYDTRWLEKKFSVGHVGTGSMLVKDKIAIMNEGYTNTGEFRGRYFKHFGRAILNAFWGLNEHVIPIKHNGKVVARQVQGRIALLKRDIAGSPPYNKDVLPFNPQFTWIQIAKT